MKMILALIIIITLSFPVYSYDVNQLDDLNYEIIGESKEIFDGIDSFMTSVIKFEKALKDNKSDSELIELKNSINENLENFIIKIDSSMEIMNPLVLKYKNELDEKLKFLDEDDQPPPEKNGVNSCYNYRESIINNINNITYIISDISRISSNIYQINGSTIERLKTRSDLLDALEMIKFIKKLDNIKNKFKNFPKLLEKLRNNII